MTANTEPKRTERHDTTPNKTRGARSCAPRPDTAHRPVLSGGPDRRWHWHAGDGEPPLSGTRGYAGVLCRDAAPPYDLAGAAPRGMPPEPPRHWGTAGIAVPWRWPVCGGHNAAPAPQPGRGVVVPAVVGKGCAASSGWAGAGPPGQHRRPPVLGGGEGMPRLGRGWPLRPASAAGARLVRLMGGKPVAPDRFAMAAGARHAAPAARSTVLVHPQPGPGWGGAASGVPRHVGTP